MESSLGPELSRYAKHHFRQSAPNSPPPRQPDEASRNTGAPDARRGRTDDCGCAPGRGPLAERDALLIMMAYRHGLRASELAGSRWDQIDPKAGAFLVARRKNGSPSTHPLRGPELRCAALLEAPAGREGALRVYVIARRSNDVSHDPFHSYSGRQGCRHQFPSSSSHAARHATASSDGRRPGCASNALPRAQEYSTNDDIPS
jgi:integrase